ncbi:unnamed protein product [Gadus morhua 'NCC']
MSTGTRDRGLRLPSLPTALSLSSSDETPESRFRFSLWQPVTAPGYLICSQESDSSQTAKKDMLAALRARQDALEETLKLRLEELKNICIREAPSG